MKSISPGEVSVIFTSMTPVFQSSGSRGQRHLRVSCKLDLASVAVKSDALVSARSPDPSAVKIVLPLPVLIRLAIFLSADLNLPN